VFQCAAFRRASTDAFFLSVDAADPLFSAADTAGLLRSLGARATEVYRHPSAGRRIPGALKAGAALLAASWALAACLRGCRPEACGAAAALEDNIRRGVYGDELCGFPGKEKEKWRW